MLPVERGAHLIVFHLYGAELAMERHRGIPEFPSIEHRLLIS
jgi:hypothetical protein